MMLCETTYRLIMAESRTVAERRWGGESVLPRASFFAGCAGLFLMAVMGGDGSDLRHLNFS